MSFRRSGVRSAEYATGLDGVRALAVVAVLLYHVGLPWLPGGFAGVDLFFVVSGYLVTALLQREHDRKGRIDLIGFWQRRGRRLLPALGVVVLVASAVSWLVGRDLGAGLRWQVLGAATFSSNWWQIGKQQSYVESMEPSLLTHLWSLAVEEQFYLLWPLVTICLLTLVRRRGIRVAVVLGLAALSAAAMAVGWSGGDPTRIYVGTDTHGFGLLLGAALAFARPDSAIDPVRGFRGRRPATDWIGWISLPLVVAGFFVLDLAEPATYRGGLLLFTLAAVGLVAAAVRPVGTVQRVLSAGWLRPIGLRSYSLYLWHWPALVVAWRLWGPTLGRPVASLLAVVLALVATELTWRFVEDPVRRYGVRGVLRRWARVLFRDRAAGTVRRPVAWVAAGAAVSVLTTAVVAVLVAPTRSELELRLAAGQEALASASRTVSAPTTPVTSRVPSVTVPSLEPTTSAGRTPSTGPVPSTSKPKASGSAPSTSPRASAGPSRSSTATTAPKPSPSSTASATSRPSSSSTPPPPPPPVTGDQVVALGDSVMLASAPALVAALPGADIDASVNRQLWDLPTLLQRPLRSHLVLGLGTNGTQSAARTLEQLSVVPPETVVVLVTAAGPLDWKDEVNAQLRAVAEQRPHTCVADWQTVVEPHPHHLAADGVHPDEIAGQWYADLVVRTLQTCR